MKEKRKLGPSRASLLGTSRPFRVEAGELKVDVEAVNCLLHAFGYPLAAKVHKTSRARVFVQPMGEGDPSEPGHNSN